MDENTPVIFQDGTAFYQKLAKTYKKHDRGLFILAPSGAGKTYFVKNQKTMDWMDGDMLWPKANADLTGDSWTDDMELVKEIDIKCDVITLVAKKQGFWVIGASNEWLKPDAIVIPPWETHMRYINMRESGEYDGGATSEDIDGVKLQRKIISKWSAKGVPSYSSIEEAANYLAANL